jgi:hypothetical protein
MLVQRGDAIHCTECGREYDAQDEELMALGVCPSDDCPSNEDDEEFVFDEVDAGDVFDIEYDH